MTAIRINYLFLTEILFNLLKSIFRTVILNFKLPMNTKRKRSRYIFCGIIRGTDKISDYRLIYSCTRYSLGQLIRVNLPSDLTLVHYEGDSYSTTEDERTLEELGYDVFICYNGRWVKASFLKEYEPHEWYMILRDKYKVYTTSEGYFSIDKYKDYVHRIMHTDPKNRPEHKYPRFRYTNTELLDIL